MSGQNNNKNVSLSMSIFGNKQTTSTSLANSIFGSMKEDKNVSNPKIFDNSSRFLNASANLQQKHTYSMKKRRSDNCNDPDDLEEELCNNKEILAMRERRSTHPSSSKATRYITFDLAKEGVHVLKKILQNKKDEQATYYDKAGDYDIQKKRFEESEYTVGANLSRSELEHLREEETLLEAQNAVRTIFEEMGVTVLKSECQSGIDSNDGNHFTAQIFPPDLMKDMINKAKEIENEICQRLDEKGDLWRVEMYSGDQKKKITFVSEKWNEPPPKKNKKGETNSQKNSPYNWRYQEVACRCPGRLDVRYNMDQPPFNDPRITNNPFLTPLIQNLLGSSRNKSCEGSSQNSLVYAGLIYSFPGSSDQPWHMDGTTLFPEEDIDLPPYALNVFIPLNDVTPDIGPTEFLPASHLCEEAKILEKDLLKWTIEKSRIEKNKRVNNNSRSDGNLDGQFSEEEWLNCHSVMAPQLKVGDVLLYDYRVCHRGTKNLSQSGKTRTMLYLLFSRPWFKEHMNFGGEHLFPENGSDEKKYEF